MNFNSFLLEEYTHIEEALITFGGSAFPKFGNVIIMAGGAGSGKGFIKKHLVGAEGFTFDVDQLKTLASATPKIVKAARDEFGVDLPKLAKNLKNPENVSKLHDIIGSKMSLDDRRVKALYTSILSAPEERKPNIIFDVTLKDLRKLDKISRQVQDLGYKKENIHIVWVVNDIEVAKKQNLERDRVVPVEILVNTHRGASHTMHDILSMGQKLNKYMDGDIVIAFNRVGVDADFQVSGKGGAFIKDANYFYVKRQGKPVTSPDKLKKSIKSKISKYVPKNVDWS